MIHLHPTIISICRTSLFIPRSSFSPRSSFCSNFICKNKLFWIEHYISRNCIIEFWIDIQTKQIVKYFQVRNQWDLLIRRYLPSVLGVLFVVFCDVPASYPVKTNGIYYRKVQVSLSFSIIEALALYDFIVI